MSATTTPPPLSDYLQELDLTEDCKDLLPTLPSEKGWISSHIFLYAGFWFPAFHLNGLLSCRNNFIAHDGDIILATTPKSGTTWLKAILFALSHRVRPATGEGSSSWQQDSPLLVTNPHELVPYLEMGLYVNKPDPELSSFTSPRIFSTHIPYSLLPDSIKATKCKVVYLCREVKDIFTSLWHFANKTKLKEGAGDTLALEEAVEKFCRGVNTFGPCWDHILEYWKASLEMPAEKLLFLKYEDVKERPVETVKRLAEFIGCPFNEDGDEDDEEVKEILSMCSLGRLRELEVNKSGKLRNGMENKVFFRKGEVGDWMNLLTPEMASKLDCVTEKKLRGSGLKL